MAATAMAERERDAWPGGAEKGKGAQHEGGAGGEKGGLDGLGGFGGVVTVDLKGTPSTKSSSPRGRYVDEKAPAGFGCFWFSIFGSCPE